MMVSYDFGKFFNSDMLYLFICLEHKFIVAKKIMTFAINIKKVVINIFIEHY